MDLLQETVVNIVKLKLNTPVVVVVVIRIIYYNTTRQSVTTWFLHL